MEGNKMYVLNIKNIDNDIEIYDVNQFFESLEEAQKELKAQVDLCKKDPNFMNVVYKDNYASVLINYADEYIWTISEKK